MYSNPVNIFNIIKLNWLINTIVQTVIGKKFTLTPLKLSNFTPSYSLSMGIKSTMVIKLIVRLSNKLRNNLGRIWFCIEWTIMARVI